MKKSYTVVYRNLSIRLFTWFDATLRLLVETTIYCTQKEQSEVKQACKKMDFNTT